MKNLNPTLIAKLVVFHIAIIALANYTVARYTGTFLGYDFSWAMFIFPLVILATDLTVRLSNHWNARVIVAIAYIPAIWISAELSDLRIGLASASAYLVGQLLDIFVFQRIRQRASAWWVAPAISTFFANIIDTYLFYSAAFYQSTDAFMSENWLQIASVDLVFKIVVSIIVFLPIYGALLGFMQRRAPAT